MLLFRSTKYQLTPFERGDFMQLQDMVGRIRKTLGEVEPNGYGSQQPGDGSWDNSQIIGYLNEALKELSHDWRKEDSYTYTPTVNQTDFALPTDCMEDGLRKVVYITNANTDPIANPVTPTNLDHYLELSRLASTAPNGSFLNRRAYTVWQGDIKLYPGVSQTSDSLKIYYFRVPATLVNATDVPEIPERFHQALIYYGLRECQNAVEEVNLEFDAGQKWDQERLRFKAEMSRKQRDRNRVRGRR